MKSYTVDRPHELFTVAHHPHPERTAYREVGGTCRCRIWTSRDAMLQTVRKQSSHAPARLDWKPLIREYAHERPDHEQALAERFGVA